MRKLFEAEHGEELANQVSEWIKKQTLTEDCGCKVFRPYAVVEIFDQSGSPLTNEK